MGMAKTGFCFFSWKHQDPTGGGLRLCERRLCDESLGRAAKGPAQFSSFRVFPRSFGGCFSRVSQYLLRFFFSPRFKVFFWLF